MRGDIRGAAKLLKRNSKKKTPSDLPYLLPSNQGASEVRMEENRSLAAGEGVGEGGSTSFSRDDGGPRDILTMELAASPLFSVDPLIAFSLSLYLSFKKIIRFSPSLRRTQEADPRGGRGTSGG